jgi:N-methylhydantoinase A
VARIARSLNTSLEEAALGIIRICNANMEAAIRVISVERGLDPRSFTLVAFGGAGPLHACELASALRIPRVLVPTTPGVLSALGMLVADTLKDYVRTVMIPIEGSQEILSTTLAGLEEQGRADLSREGISTDQQVIERYLDLRYVGQSYELTIPFEEESGQAAQQFHLAHERRFGYNDPNERIQVVNVRLKARGSVDLPVLERLTPDPQIEVKPVATGQVVFASSDGPATYEVPVYDRASLLPGTTLSQPAIITQYDTTTVVPPAWSLSVDVFGNLLIENVGASNEVERTHAW